MSLNNNDVNENFSKGFFHNKNTLCSASEPRIRHSRKNKLNVRHNTDNSCLVSSNIWLIVVILTFTIFNFLKLKVFDGHLICVMELFYTCAMLFIGFYFSTLNICDTKGEIVTSSIQNSLIVFLVTSIVTTFNPCKNYLPMTQIVVFNSLIIAMAYNAILLLIRKNKSAYCTKSGSMKQVFILLAIHLIKIFLFR